MSETSCYSFPMTIPPPSQLVDVLKEGLTQNFEEVVVEWVDCPDLTYPPFNLAAPGLCGNTAMVQVGGTGNMFPEMKREQFISFFDLIQIIKRSARYNFIIGGCITWHEKDRRKYFGELITNAVLIDRTLCACRSRFVYMGRLISAIDYLSLNKYNCAMMGNFYTSEGNPGTVLKVYAKNRTGKLEFINAMQSALAKHFPVTFMSDLCVGLGGVFVASLGNMKHHIIPNCWSGITSQDDLRSALHYIDIGAPFTSLGTFLNTDRHIANNVNGRPCIKPVGLTTRQFYTFDSWRRGGFYEGDLSSEIVEYLGYFYPAEYMYCIAPSVNPTVPDLIV